MKHGATGGTEGGMHNLSRGRRVNSEQIDPEAEWPPITQDSHWTVGFPETQQIYCTTIILILTPSE